MLLFVVDKQETNKSTEEIACYYVKMYHIDHWSHTLYFTVDYLQAFFYTVFWQIECTRGFCFQKSNGTWQRKGSKGNTWNSNVFKLTDGF